MNELENLFFPHFFEILFDFRVMVLCSYLQLKINVF